MANPFLNMLGTSPQTAGQPAPSGGAGIAAPAPQNVAPAPVPGGGSGGSSPFGNALMTSDAPGIFGILGRLSGNPTSTELMYHRMGAGQQLGLEGLAQRIQGDPAHGVAPMSQQQAILDWATHDPNASKVWQNSADPVGTIRGFLSTLAPPEIYGTVGNSVFNKQTGKIGESAPRNIGPGEGIVNSQNQIVAGMPTAETQTFTSLANIAKLEPGPVQDLAKASLLAKSTTDPSVKADAFKQLVAQGVLTPQQSAKFQSGLIQVQPFTDSTGNPMGLHVMDLSKYVQTGDPKDIVATVAGINSSQSSVPQAAQSLKPEYDEFGISNKVQHPPADIAFAAGPIGQLADHIGAYTSIIDPAHLTPEYYNDAHDKMDMITGMLNDLVQSGHGGYNAALNEFKDIASEHGYLGGPIQQLIAFRNVVQAVQRDIQVNNGIISDMSGRSGKTGKEQADQFNARLKPLLAALPTLPDIEGALTQARQGKGGMTEAAQKFVGQVGAMAGGVKQNLTSALNAGVDAANSATDAVTGAPASGGNNPLPSFQNAQDAAAALKAGKLTPGDDGTVRVIINGQPGTLRPKAKK